MRKWSKSGVMFQFERLRRLERRALPSTNFGSVLKPITWWLTSWAISFRGVAIERRPDVRLLHEWTADILRPDLEDQEVRTGEFDSSDLPTRLRALGSFTPRDLANSQRVSQPRRAGAIPDRNRLAPVCSKSWRVRPVSLRRHSRHFRARAL